MSWDYSRQTAPYSSISRERPNLTALLVALGRAIPDKNFTFTGIPLNRNHCAAAHVDANNVGTSYIIGRGVYSHGKLWLMDERGTEQLPVTRPVMGPKFRTGDILSGNLHDARHQGLAFGGLTPHAATEFEGARMRLVSFTSRYPDRMAAERRQRIVNVGFPLPESLLLDVRPEMPPFQSSSDDYDDLTASVKVEFAREAEWLTFDAQEPPAEALAQDIRPVAATPSSTPKPEPRMFWRLVIADTGASYDVIKRDHLMQDERPCTTHPAHVCSTSAPTYCP